MKSHRILALGLIFFLLGMGLANAGQVSRSFTAYASYDDDEDVYPIWDCFEFDWLGCDSYWNWCAEDCLVYYWDIELVRTVSWTVQAGRTYTVTYRDDYGAVMGSETFTATASGTAGLTWTRYNTYIACDWCDLPPPWYYVSLNRAEITETWNTQYGDIDEDGASDEYFTAQVLEDFQVLGNGDVTGRVKLPAGFTTSNSTLMVSYRGQLVALKDIAEMLGKTIEQIFDIINSGGEFEILIKQTAIDVLISEAVQWVVSKLGIPADSYINLGFAYGDPLIPLYKNRYDGDRRSFLGNLDWFGAGLSNGTLQLEPTANGHKIDLYYTPSKHSPKLPWGKKISIKGPLAVRNYYVEGVETSENQNDVLITLRFTPEQGPTLPSPVVPCTVYDVRFMKYKESSYSDASDFASKQASGVLSDSDLEEISDTSELPPGTMSYPRLSVGKWENAFDGSTLRPNFVELDRDQFMVLIEGFGNGNPDVELSLATQSDLDTYPRIENLDNPVNIPDHLVNASLPLAKFTWESYDDGFDAQTLEQRPSDSGRFYSQPQLLVADGGTNSQGVANPEGDDDWPRISGSNDNFADDPTHSVALGSRVIARVSIDGAQQPDFELTVEPKGSIFVNVVVFNEDAGAAPVRSLSDVADEWKAVAERFAQAGVRVAYTIRYGVDPAADLPENLTATEPLPSGTGHGPTAQVKDLIDGHRDASADFNALYVRNIVAGSLAGPQANNLAHGVAYRESYFGAANPTYTEFLLLAGEGQAEANLLTAAHELGHLVGDMGHSSDDRNLMKGTVSGDRLVLSTKRLDGDQQQKIVAKLGL